MTTAASAPRESWNPLPWTRVQRNGFQLQKRIYRAASRGDIPTVRKRQRLLRHSWSAKLLAVRRGTQDNRGKKTAGIDGVQSLTPNHRLR
jgi:RNA-directed DNA polymerase